VESGVLSGEEGYSYFILDASDTMKEARKIVIPETHFLFDIGYNGYVILPVEKCPKNHEEVPVHGGITLVERIGKSEKLYGFDTGHFSSRESPIRDVGWIKEQIILMKNGLLAQKELEDKKEK
jgi:hypothetical protein